MTTSPSEPVERLLGHLDRVKRQGSGFIARCPAHQDRNPSLSVSEGDDGRVLVRCHAGCTVEAIVAAAGIELRDLFPTVHNAKETPATNGEVRARGQIVETYDYVDEAGTMLFQAVRFEPKGFAQRRRTGDTWTWKLGDTRRVLYRLPSLLDAVCTDSVVYVVEGERDVHALEKLGVVATCNAMGAGKWRDEYAESLRGAGRVVIVPDDDEPGRAHAEQVARSVAGVVNDVRIVEVWPRGDSSTDVADWIAYASSDEQLRQARGLLEEIVERTPRFSIPPPIALEAGGNEIESGLKATPIESLIANVPPEPDWVWRGYVAPFAVTLLAGRPKVGKSTFVFALLARLVAGAQFVGLDTAAAGVLVLSEERRDTLAEKARILGLVSIPPPTFPIDGNKRKPTHVLMRHDAGTTSWPELVRQRWPTATSTTSAPSSSTRGTAGRTCAVTPRNAAGAVNEALEPLQYAAASGLAVLIVSHQRKSLGEFGEAVRGSNALTGGVDIVLELERPAASLALGRHARALRAVSRFASTPEELYVELDEEAAEFVPIESPEEVKAAAEQTRIVELLAGLGAASSTEVAEAVELPDSTVRRHLNTLLDRGHVVREGEGKRGNPFRWRVFEGDESL